MEIMIMIMLITVIMLSSRACQEKVWRRHKILCCSNGSAIKNASGKWVWVQQRPLVCGPLRADIVGKTMSTLTSVAVILGTISCVACHIDYGVAYMFHRIFRQLW